LTGSLPTVNTIGIVEVAALAACGELVEPMAMITAPLPADEIGRKGR
jgi:hypothetical protein